MIFMHYIHNLNKKNYILSYVIICLFDYILYFKIRSAKESFGCQFHNTILIIMYSIMDDAEIKRNTRLSQD